MANNEHFVYGFIDGKHFVYCLWQTLSYCTWFYDKRIVQSFYGKYLTHGFMANILYFICFYGKHFVQKFYGKYLAHDFTVGVLMYMIYGMPIEVVFVMFV